MSLYSLISDNVPYVGGTISDGLGYAANIGTEAGNTALSLLSGTEKFIADMPNMLHQIDSGISSYLSNPSSFTMIIIVVGILGVGYIIKK